MRFNSSDSTLEKKGDSAVSESPRYGMVVDLRKCIGCHACSVACKAELGVPLGVFRMWVKQVEIGFYPNVVTASLPSLCNQCSNPICLQNCPTRATYQLENGIVVVDPHRCIGCKYCIASCPYNVRHINPLKKIVQKCEFCLHRVEAGLEPACVNTCPTGALIFGDLNDHKSQVSDIIIRNAVQVLKPDRGTFPQVYYVGANMLLMEARGPVGGEE
ncbi:MAG: 4Fe-4S dicluster domain-containing protein [Dehalococcoidia bacterium]|nr:4Fe-4S dicluster domain-containing protein [Dehalococcoidia bacterium]